jgi:hypothetical protein
MEEEALELRTGQALALEDTALLVSERQLEDGLCKVNSDERRLHFGGLLYAGDHDVKAL